MHDIDAPSPLVTAGATDLPTLVLATLIARSERDSIEVTRADVQRLFELYPQGWGIVLAGFQDGALKATLVGEQSKDVLRDLLERAARGDCIADDLHPSFMPEPAPDERS